MARILRTRHVPRGNTLVYSRHSSSAGSRGSARYTALLFRFMREVALTLAARISRREDEDGEAVLAARRDRSARWTKKAARIIQQVGRFLSSPRDRPPPDSQTAFSATTRCTSVRRCLIHALIKSQKRESRFALAHP